MVVACAFMWWFACAEPAFYPEAPPPDTSEPADTSTDTGAVTDTDTDTDPDPDLPCSSPSGAAVFLTTVNETAQTGTMFWRNELCDEILYQTVPAGGSVGQATFAGHVWVLRNPGGSYLGHYTVIESVDPVWTVQ